jgi:UDP-glucose 4-epimerase
MLNPYSITKTTTEKFCRMFSIEHATRVNMIRAVNAYGPHQRAAAPYASGKVRKITPAFVCRALTGEPIEVYGDGEQVSDMVWVRDVALALVIALERANEGTVFPDVVEVGPSISANVNEVAELVAEYAAAHTGTKVPIVHAPMRPGEIAGDRVTADTKTLRHVELTDADLVSLTDGMRETVDWFARNEGVTWSRP